MFKALDRKLGQLRVDLFATRLNNQLSNYISWRPDTFAIAADALQVPWRGMQGYAFPLFSLVGRCLQKLSQEQATVVLVAPVWPVQAWFPTLLASLVELPFLLQPYRDLLKDPFGNPHPLLLQMPAVWKVSGDASRQEAFHRKLQNPSHIA